MKLSQQGPQSQLSLKPAGEFRIFTTEGMLEQNTLKMIQEDSKESIPNPGLLQLLKSSQNIHSLPSL